MHFDHQCLNSLLLLVYRTTASAAISSIHMASAVFWYFGNTVALLVDQHLLSYSVYQYAMLSKLLNF